MHLLLLLPLLGCRSGEVGTPDGAGLGDDAPSEWSYEPDDDPTPVFDQAAIEAGLQAAIDIAPSLTAQPVIDGYFELMSLSDADCPSYYEVDGNVFWQDYCTSDAGVFFDGYGFYYPYVDVDLEGNGNVWNGDYFYGVANIVTPGGERLQLGGGAVMISSYDETYGGWRHQSQVLGGFDWTDPGSDAGWMADGIVADTYLYAIEYPEYAAQGMQVHGGFSDPDGAVWGGEATAVLFDYNLIFDEALGSVCEEEPTGVIQLRDAEGTWWSVVFDTPAEGAMDDPDQCDGCGTVYLGSDEVGRACLDFGAWIDWEVTPW